MANEYATTTVSFLVDDEEDEVTPPPVVEPEGEGWSLTSTAILPREDNGDCVMFYTWVRSNSGRYRTPCPGPEGQHCGSIAIKEGVCVGCGLDRSAS